MMICYVSWGVSLVGISAIIPVSVILTWILSCVTELSELNSYHSNIHVQRHLLIAPRGGMGHDE